MITGVKVLLVFGLVTGRDWNGEERIEQKGTQLKASQITARQRLQLKNIQYRNTLKCKIGTVYTIIV